MKIILKIFYLFFLIVIAFFQIFCRFETQISLQEHIEYLASDELQGRYPTTKGDTLAREYILSQYSSYRLIPFDSDSYLQGFDYLSMIKANGSIEIYKLGSKQILSKGKDFIIRLQSGSGKIKGKLYYIGYGINNPKTGYNDYKNVKDKIVISYLFPHKDISSKIKFFTKNYGWQDIIKKAEQNGAIGAIFIVPDVKYDRLIKTEDKFPYSQRLKQFSIPVIQFSRSTLLKVLSNVDFDIISIENQLKSSDKSLSQTIPYLDINIQVSNKYIYKKAYNILGQFPGQNTSRTIIIGAHYDHLPPEKTKDLQDTIRNGANDNASGVALLLHTAKTFASFKGLRSNLMFICFSAEEAGMIGSKYFINNSSLHQNNIKAMINLDMVGRMNENTLYVNHFSKYSKWNSISEIFEKSDLNIKFDNMEAGTDADPFISNNIPAIWLSTGFFNDQHKVTDNFDKINLKGIKKIHDFLIELIINIDRFSF